MICTRWPGRRPGWPGSSGDGSAAVSAKLIDPESVELDNGKQMYIADAGNSKIREVARTRTASGTCR